MTECQWRGEEPKQLMFWCWCVCTISAAKEWKVWFVCSHAHTDSDMDVHEVTQMYTNHSLTYTYLQIICIIYINNCTQWYNHIQKRYARMHAHTHTHAHTGFFMMYSTILLHRVKLSLICLSCVSLTRHLAEVSVWTVLYDRASQQFLGSYSYPLLVGGKVCLLDKLV